MPRTARRERRGSGSKANPYLHEATTRAVFPLKVGVGSVHFTGDPVLDGILIGALVAAGIAIAVAAEMRSPDGAADPAEGGFVRAGGLIEAQMRTYPENQRRESAFADFCQVLLCLNEFIYVD